MKQTLIRTGLVTMVCAALAACGNSEDKSKAAAKSAPAPAAEASNAPKAATESFFPEFDASLLEPITISAEKSDAALEEMQKYTQMMDEIEPKMTAIGRELQSMARNERSNKEPSDAIKQKSREFTEAYDQNLKVMHTAIAGIKDAEVKMLAERNTRLAVLGKEATVIALDAAMKLNKSGSRETRDEFMKQLREQQEKIRKAQGILQKGFEDFGQKYSAQ